MRFKTPQKVLFIEELNDIVTENFPDFWKLGNAYFAGSLLHKEVSIIKYLIYSIFSLSQCKYFCHF